MEVLPIKYIHSGRSGRLPNAPSLHDQIKMQINKYHLENEKKNFLIILNQFIDGIQLEKMIEPNFEGRPRACLSDVVKSLLIMSYHCWSYRRSNSDVEDLFSSGSLTSLPRRATLNKYMSKPEIKKVLQELIELSSLVFIDSEDCLILDSTWFAKFMPLATGHKKLGTQRQVKLPSLRKTTKVHVAMLRNSKCIVSAIPTKGTEHDSPFFSELLTRVKKNGFNIKTLLADAAYMSKSNYSLAQSFNMQSFIDFRRGVNLRRAKSKAWRDQLTMYRQEPEKWHESYRFRVLIESVFSSIKRKGNNYLRSRKFESQQSEMLLKILVSNLCIIAKHYL